MIRLLVVFLALPLMFSMAPASAQVGKANAGLPTTQLKLGSTTITVEVAAKDEQRQVGLMNRFSMPPDHGMLFVFDRPGARSFWMRNTYIPLSIAFIDAHGRIINIEDMAPKDERSTRSSGPALYALEMRKGWFAQRGIEPGAIVQGLPPPSAE
jgi:uncharacterized membrane protein (UPF0127 family)